MGDSNPFDDNPFNNVHGSVPSASGAWGTSSANAYDTPAAVVTVNNKELGSQEANLNRRERELNQREQELRRLETELRNRGGSSSNKNWPKFCPIVRHDIAGEVPAALQGMVRCAYWAFLGLVLCMAWNFIGTIAAMIGCGGDNLSAFLWAAIYALGGIPGAFILWYMRVYNAAIKDSAFGYAIFFAGFMAHLVFVGWSAIAPPILNSWSHTGYWSAIRVISQNTGAGVIYFIGAALWSLEFVWSFWTLKVVYSAFRGKNMNMAQIKREAAARAATSQV
ncbi:hypothetical protein N2152v2_001681 [Parachlorella kessleri]